MIKLPVRRLRGYNFAGHTLGTYKGLLRLPMFLARHETKHTMFLEVGGKVLLSRNKFERKILDKKLAAHT